MLKGRSFIGWLTGFSLALAATGAWAAPDLSGLPDRYLPGSRDETPVFADGPSGTLWSAWAWHERGEYDLAIAFRSAGGVWELPRFLGRNDGVDQRDATLVVDELGTVYVAFTVDPGDRVHLAMLPEWSNMWVGPFPVGDETVPAAHPSLRMLGDRVILAYLAGSDIVIRDFETLAPPAPVTSDGIQEGPDVIDPLGRTADREDDSDDGSRESWKRPGDAPDDTGTFEIRPGLDQRNRRN